MVVVKRCRLWFRMKTSRKWRPWSAVIAAYYGAATTTNATSAFGDTSSRTKRHSRVITT
jgi:hypothetical protein